MQNVPSNRRTRQTIACLARFAAGSRAGPGAAGAAPPVVASRRVRWHRLRALAAAVASAVVAAAGRPSAFARIHGVFVD